MDALEQEWNRAYLIKGTTVLAVWTHDPTTGRLHYLARASNYSGELRPPFVTRNKPIATAVWTDKMSSSDAHRWATSQLADGAATAILLKDSAIHTAWEMIDGQPHVVACQSPRP